MIDEERAKSEVWEPWVPTLRQLVRVRLSGECRDTSRRLVTRRYDLPSGTRPSGEPLYYVSPLALEGHHAIEDGVLGVVGMIETVGAHRFGVLFHQPFYVGRRDPLPIVSTKGEPFEFDPLNAHKDRVDGGYFAAVELEPVTDLHGVGPDAPQSWIDGRPL